jgi:uncharacterized protein (TIGR00255 family)
MLKSMTGFGRGEGETGLGRILVESRSVNHRYCEIGIKLPKRLAPFEARIKEMIRSLVSRGKIDVSVKLDSTGEERIQLAVDLNLASQYYKALQSLKETLQVKDDITLELIAAGKDVIMVREEAGEIEPYWQEIVPILQRSLQDMDSMKRSEGESLRKDLQERLEQIAREFETIKLQYPFRLGAYQTRLHERLRALLEGSEIDASRFQQEVAFLAERMDITEEVVRAESHLSQFAVLLKGTEPVGRKLDFLLQELNREANTVTSKANDAEISQRVVEIKSELEKIREQVQNIE